VSLAKYSMINKLLNGHFFYMKVAVKYYWQYYSGSWHSAIASIEAAGVPLSIFSEMSTIKVKIFIALFTLEKPCFCSTAPVGMSLLTHALNLLCMVWVCTAWASMIWVYILDMGMCYMDRHSMGVLQVDMYSGAQAWIQRESPSTVTKLYD
jgi:hypothetical protein